MTATRVCAAVAAAAMLLAAGACTGDGDGVALPSERPSIERTVEGDRTPDRTPETDDAEPTRTRTPEATRTEDPEPTRTEDPEPTRTREPEPTRTQEPEPTRTQEPEPTRTEEPEPTRTEETPDEPTPAATTTSAAAVPVAEEDSGDWLGWLLLFVLLGGVIAIVLVSRSRRVAVWTAQADSLTTETRGVLGVRLPPVLSAVTTADRDQAWPPVRDDLLNLSARWGAHAERAVDGAQHALAGGAAVLLHDLVTAVDAENAALAAGRDWRMLRPQTRSILDALAATLQPQPAPAGYPGPAAGYQEAPPRYPGYPDPPPEDPGPPPYTR